MSQHEAKTSAEPYFVIEQGAIVQCFGPDGDAFAAELLMRLKRGDKLIGSDRIKNGLYVEFEARGRRVDD